MVTKKAKKEKMAMKRTNKEKKKKVKNQNLPVYGAARRKAKVMEVSDADMDFKERLKRVRTLSKSLGIRDEKAERAKQAALDRLNMKTKFGDAYYELGAQGRDLLNMVDDDEVNFLLKAVESGNYDTIIKGVSVKKSDSGRKRKLSEGSETESDSNDYDNEPRSFEKVRQLLPIKTSQGIVKRKMVVSEDKSENESEEARTSETEEKVDEIEEKPNDSGIQLEFAEEKQSEVKSVAEIYADRHKQIETYKIRMGLLAKAVLEEPHEKYENLLRLLDMCGENDARLMLTVRKYAVASMLEVFKDLLPDYKLREHQDEKRLKKETKKLYEYENTLLKSYKNYLIRLEEHMKWLDSKDAPYHGLGELSLKCMCECLVNFRDFNYCENLVNALIPYLNHRIAVVRENVTQAVKTVFKEDLKSHLALQIVKKIHQLIKSRDYNCRREITDLFMHLRIRNVNLDKEKENEIKSRKFMNHKEKLKQLSKRERKRAKRLETVEREMLATKAEENKSVKEKYHTEIITVVFTIYFKILKQMPKSSLMASVLEGLAKYAHMINVDFFHDLVDTFDNLLSNDILNQHQTLLCVQTVFSILSGQGDVIAIDMQRFFTHLYKALFSMESAITDLPIGLKALDCMFLRRRKSASLTRVLAFIKRLAIVALQTEHPSTLAILSFIRSVFLVYPQCSRLIDVETGGGSGPYLPETEEPEHCGAANAIMYELPLLRRHYHPHVRQLASHVTDGCPAQGHNVLEQSFVKMAPLDYLSTYSTEEMNFVPPVPSPKRKKETKRMNNKRKKIEMKKIKN